MDYKVTDTQLTNIANAIRTKGGTSAQLEFPTEFISAINAIVSGSSNILFGSSAPTSGSGRDGDVYLRISTTQYTSLITKTVTANGTYTASSENAYGYSQVTVSIPDYDLEAF